MRVTVHNHSGATSSAVDLADGCFGTTTVMRIASMFVPTNIFQVLPSPPPRSLPATAIFRLFQAGPSNDASVIACRPAPASPASRPLEWSASAGAATKRCASCMPDLHFNDVMWQRCLHRITVQTAAGSARITRSRRQWRRLPGSPEGRAPPLPSTACRAPSACLPWRCTVAPPPPQRLMGPRRQRCCPQGAQLPAAQSEMTQLPSRTWKLLGRWTERALLV